MNEINQRIKEMTIQTLGSIHYSVIEPPLASSVDVGEVSIPLVFAEAFAEKIVRQCSQFTDPVTRIHMFKHFGIEE